MKHWLLLVVLLLSVAGASSAFELGLSADSVSASWCTPATVSAWVAGAREGSTAYFSVESGYATAVVGTPQTLVGSSGNAETNVVLHVPQCFLGANDATVTAQVCKDGCETRSKKIRVNAFSCPEIRCSYVTSPTSSTSVAGPVFSAASPQAMCGSAPCSEVVSSIVLEKQFPPSSYRAVLERSVFPRCLSAYCSFDQAVPGEALALQIKARNQGATGNFEASASTESNWLVVSPKSVSFDLSRRESTNLDFAVQVKPGTPAGIYGLSFKLWHAGRQLDSLSHWIEVVGEAGGEAKLQIPPEIVLDSCAPPQKIAVPASIESTGPTQEFDVSAFLRGERVFAEKVIAEQRIASQFSLFIDYSKLQIGQNLLEVSASSRDFAGSGATRIVLLACQAPVQPPTALPSETPAFDFANQSGNKITIVATVVNDGNEVLAGVRGELVGLPQAWNYSSAVINVAPKSEENLTVIVLATTQETSSPTLAIKSGDKIISLRQLAELNKPSTLTGFLVSAASQNLAAIFLAMAVISGGLLYLAVKNRRELEEIFYRRKINRMKQELARMDSAAGA